MKTKLYRSERDKKLFGLCGGLAEVFNIDATLLRLVVVVTAFFSAGTMILLYLIASMIIPKESELNPPFAYGVPPNPHVHAHHFQHEPPTTSSGIDEMMEDIEKKALRKEIEQLRAKLAKYEKGEL